MVDIILDTSAAKILLRNRDYIEKVIKVCDHIYIPHCWSREMKQFPIHMISELSRKHRKLHKVRVEPNLPEYIERAFSGDECDKEYITLALERKRHQPTVLVSEDRHFLDLANILSNDRLKILDSKNELKRVLEN